MSHRSWVFTKLDDHQQERQTRKKQMHEILGEHTATLGKKSLTNGPCTSLKSTRNLRIVSKKWFAGGEKL